MSESSSRPEERSLLSMNSGGSNSPRMAGCGGQGEMMGGKLRQQQCVAATKTRGGDPGMGVSRNSTHGMALLGWLLTPHRHVEAGGTKLVHHFARLAVCVVMSKRLLSG